MDTLEQVPATDDIETEVEERLEVYVRAYISEFQDKLEEYAKEAAVGGTAKLGKIAGKVVGPVATAFGAATGASVLGAAGISVGKGVGGKGVEKGLNYLIGKNHRTKAKKITQIFQTVKPDGLRRMFVEAASLIYYSFQSQFESVTDADSNWKRALRKLAIDARNRSISYIYNEEMNLAIEALSKDLLTKAVILGESKVSLISHVIPKKMQQIIPGTKPGYTVKSETKEWKTSDIYEKVGIKIVESNGKTKYYKKNMCGNDFGYRWAFSWEYDSWWISTYQEEDYSNVLEDPRTSLKVEELEVKIGQILTNINKEDPKWQAKDNKLQFGRIEDGVDGTKETLKKLVEEIVPIKDDISEIKTKLSSELPIPRTSLKVEKLEAKMDQVLLNIHKEDPKLQLDRIEGRVDETNETLVTVTALQQEVIEDIVPMKQDLGEIKTKLLLELSKSDEPKIFNVTPPVKTFTGREPELTLLHDKLQTQQKQVVVSQCASISGLGGMGKSELARKYAHTYHEYYGSCIWIDSETQLSITQSFGMLAEKLQIPTTQKPMGADKLVERNIHLIVEDIYKRFSRSKSLFIFDNVNQFEEIEDFLPSNLSPTDEKPTIILTSRNSDWDIGDEGDVGLILLDQFTPEEALSFVKKVLEIKDEDTSHNSSISELTEEICYFPLGLRQAASYIKAKKFLTSYIKAIENYLVEFRDEKNKRDLLQYKTKRDRYTETTYTTWQITFRNIEKNEANGSLAKCIVEIMAYLTADNIFLKKFIDLAENEEKFTEAVDILIKYSIITLNKNYRDCDAESYEENYERYHFYYGNSVNIHRLVQQVIRLWLQEEKREEEVLRIALAQNDDYIFEHHRAALWSFACNYTSLIDNYLCKKSKANRSYNKLVFALKYLVEDGDVRAIQKILNCFEGRHDLWREISYHILNENLVKCNHNDVSMENTGHETHIRALILFHAEVHNALKHSNTKDLQLFLQNFDKSLINSWFNDRTALQRSAASGKLNVVKILVENKANVNTQSRYLFTALEIALNKNHIQIADYLLDHGVDLKTASFIDGTVLERACYAENFKIVKYLVPTIAKYKIGTKAYWKPLHVAVQNNHVEMVEFLINHEVYRSAMKDHGQTLCRIAAESGSIKVVKYLIENKFANVNERKCSNYETLLTTAVKTKHFDIVKYLLTDETHDKVDVNGHNALGFTALMQAVLGWNIEIPRFLIAHGAAVENIQNGNTLLGKLSISALHLAAGCNHINMVKLLVEECNADINMGLNTTFTPFQAAKYFNSKAVCKFLIRKGADTTEWSTANLENITRIIRSFNQENKAAVNDMLSKCNMINCGQSSHFKKRLNTVGSFLKQFIS